MKRKIVILICLFSIKGFSQVTAFEQNLYDEASIIQSSLYYADIESGLNSNDPAVVTFATEIRDKITNRTLEIYQELLDTLPNTKLRNRIDYRRANIFRQNGNAQLAKQYYIKVLNNPEKIQFDENNENYDRNTICIQIAKILIEEKDFENAMRYLDESKKYQKIYMCGNAIIERRQELEKLYEICRSNLKK
jgi:tetratricopeptide (TPR) repeat protein